MIDIQKAINALQLSLTALEGSSAGTRGRDEAIDAIRDVLQDDEDSPQEAIIAAEKFKLRADAARVKKAALAVVADYETKKAETNAETRERYIREGRPGHSAVPEDQKAHPPEFYCTECKTTYSGHPYSERLGQQFCSPECEQTTYDRDHRWPAERGKPVYHSCPNCHVSFAGTACPRCGRSVGPIKGGVVAGAKKAAPPIPEDQNPEDEQEVLTPEPTNEPEPTEIERTEPAIDPAPLPVPPVQPPATETVPQSEPVEISEENEENASDELAVRAQIEAEIEEPETIEAVMEFLKEEDFLSAHRLEVKEGVWGWREASTFATISFGANSEYMIAPSEEAAEEFATAMVRQQLNDEPDLFTKDWLEGYIDEEKLRDALRSDVEDSVRESPDSYGWEAGKIRDEEIARYDEEGDEDEDGEYDENGDLIEDEEESEPSEEWVESKAGELLKDPMEYLREIYGDETMKHAIRIAGINIDEAADDAVAADGAGHFLSSYDGQIHNLPNGGVWWRHN